MTAPPLSPGREMDAAVARVLGWRDVRGEPLHFSAGFDFEGRHPKERGSRPRRMAVPKFSSDHAAIPELLAWLSEHIDLRFSKGRDSQWVVGDDGGYIEWGDTLPEALCNLVLAVAARRTP